MKTYKYFVSLFLLQGLLFSLTCNVSGFVFDLKTKIPLTDANISLRGYGLGTVSKEDGSFNLYIKKVAFKDAELSIKVIGYEEKIVSVVLLDDRVDLGKIFLTSKSIQLESVHIH